MSAMALDTVFQTFADIVQETPIKTVPGSLEIRSGTVNVYFSNAEAKPANAAAMTVDLNGPFGGIAEVVQGAKWILIESASGAPVVNQFRAAVV